MRPLHILARSRPEWIDPQRYILPFPDLVTVSRPLPDNIQLSWPVAADKVQIFQGNAPDKIDFTTPLATVTKTRSFRLDAPLTAVRPYFGLLFQGGGWHGRCLITAERLLPLQQAVNFRDIGGYETRNGRFVAWGKFFRSGVLSELAASDLHYLQQLNIRLVCDLRSAQEVEKRPDKLPTNPSPQHLHFPAQSLERMAQVRGLAAILFNRAKLEGLMDEGYIRIMIDENAALIGNVLKTLADPNQLPVVVHCTAGKDRTAVITALLLSILGVSEETILADYTYSNIHYEKVEAGVAHELKGLNKQFGITTKHLQALILVKADRLQKMLTHIQQKYGSIEDYLSTAAGLKEDYFIQMRENLLTEPCQLSFTTNPTPKDNS